MSPERHIPDTAPLMCTLHSNGGKPIKSKLAKEFPTLSRRQRREIMRIARKKAAHASA